jgi:spore coat polysaccharide biosynthesis protein SpsF
MSLHNKTVAIIQARMSSSRLPKKVLLPLAGQPIISQIVRRLRSCKTLDQIILATSVNSDDHPIEALCNTINVPCFRGSLNDVLDRYYQAAQTYEAKIIVRITADCPVIDPVVVDALVTAAIAGDYDYFGHSGEFPDGLDVEIFKFQALERAWREAKLTSEREHVGPYLSKNPNLFKNGGLTLFHGLAHHRWTVDELYDYELLQIIYDRLDRPQNVFLTNEILNLLDNEPNLLKINNKIIRNAGYAKSLQEDRLIP